MAGRALSGVVLGAAAVACAASPTREPAVAVAEVAAPGSVMASAPGPAPPASSSRDTAPWPVLDEPPDGPADVGAYFELGHHQPVDVVGTLANIGPAPARGGPWRHIELDGPGRPGGRSFDLLLTPERLPLPLSVGERLHAEIDCRKGGWQRACDLVVRDRRLALRVAIASSGDARLLRGWSVARGDVGSSEVFAESPRSVRNTHGLQFRFEGKEVAAAPLTWRRLDTASGSWFVAGYEVSWEGVRPPEARNHRQWAVVRRK